MRSVVFGQKMPKVTEAVDGFLLAGKRIGFRNKWMPSIAWSNAILQTTSKNYTKTLVARAINCVCENKDRKFGDVVVHRNQRKVYRQEEGSVGMEWFYYVCLSKLIWVCNSFKLLKG